VTVITLELPVQPRTKKTSNRIVRFGKHREHIKILPSEEYEQFALECMLRRPAVHRAINFPLPITGEVAVKALFYRTGDFGDLLGYAQALADVMQSEKWSKAKPGKPPEMLRDGLGLILDDKQIRHWDGSRLCIGEPRIELEISILAESQERLI
jgi:hypothetical protein